MNSGSVNIDEGSYHQNWYGFKLFMEQQVEIPSMEQGTMIILFQKNLCTCNWVIITFTQEQEQTSLLAVMVANTIYGNGGSDYLDLNSGSSDYGYYNNAFGGERSRRYCLWSQ